MLLNDAREAYYYNSGKLGEVVRPLSLGGIALVWLFKDTVNGSTFLASELYFAIFYLAISLGLDVLQYTYASVAWGYYHRKQEKAILKANGGDIKKSGEQAFNAPIGINTPTIIFFWLKLIVFSFGYYNIVIYLYRTVYPA